MSTHAVGPQPLNKRKHSKEKRINQQLIDARLS